jgi:hypothetical protein
MKRSTSWRASVAVAASAAFFWTLVLSVSPQLHERVHPDSNRADHSCAVTFVASGNFNNTPVALLISAPVPTDEFRIPDLTPLWGVPVFLLASVFEHAPPANA